MKKIDLGQAIGVLANLGVITGIVFLGYETHQNSELLEVQVRATQLDQRMALSATLFDHPEVLELLVKDADELTPSEYRRVRLLGIQFLNTTEWSFGEVVRAGDDLDAYAKRVRSVIDREDLHYGAEVAWPVFRETANPDYVRWFEESVLGSGVE